MEALELPANGLRFTAVADGPAGGRVVLLLHGFPQTSRAWRPVMAALAAAGYRAVAPDLRGYAPGARPDGVDAYRMAHLVGDVLGLADALAAAQVDLVGHDWGGALAWQVAGRHPERVRTLTVLSTPHPAAFAAALRAPGSDQARRSSYAGFLRTPDEPEQALLAGGGQGLLALYASSGHPGGEELGEYVRLLSEPGALTGALNWYRAASRADLDGLGPARAPTLYVWSDQDIALGREAAEASATFVTGPYRFEVLEGATHWLPETAADRVIPLLLAHLAATPS